MNYVYGVVLGGVVSSFMLLALFLLNGFDLPLLSQQWLQQHILNLWLLARTNLQSSIPFFVIVVLMYTVQLVKLKLLLTLESPNLADIASRDQLLDVCSSLFFGIGVIFTAIGMRDALLFALGDPELAASQQAFSLLERLVDGGILLALSTTIVGGVGGYILRVVKSLLIGSKLNEAYLKAHNNDVENHNETLLRIERLLSERFPHRNEKERL